MKKAIVLVVVGVLAALLMCGCSDSDDSSKYTDVFALADFTFGLADSSKISTGDVVYRDNVRDYTDDEGIIALFEDDYYFNKTALLDKDTVLIQREVIFQSVVGYVVTRGEDKLDNKRVDAPMLGYDANSASLGEEMKTNRDGVKLYHYRAGL